MATLPYQHILHCVFQITLYIASNTERALNQSGFSQEKKKKKTTPCPPNIKVFINTGIRSSLECYREVHKKLWLRKAATNKFRAGDSQELIWKLLNFLEASTKYLSWSIRAK